MRSAVNHTWNHYHGFLGVFSFSLADNWRRGRGGRDVDDPQAYCVVIIIAKRGQDHKPCGGYKRSRRTVLRQVGTHNSDTGAFFFFFCSLVAWFDLNGRQRRVHCHLSTSDDASVQLRASFRGRPSVSAPTNLVPQVALGALRRRWTCTNGVCQGMSLTPDPRTSTFGLE
jgi:hypothetical protein